MKGLGEAVFWLGVFTLIVLCTGTPDLLDALIQYFMNGGCK